MNSKKLNDRIESLSNRGYFTSQDAERTGMRLVVGRAGDLAAGAKVAFYWLVDESDGVIADVKFQAFGDALLLGVMDLSSEVLLRKNHLQAKRISQDLLERALRDKNNIPAFAPEGSKHLPLIFKAIADAANQCTDIPFEEIYVAPPLQKEASSTEGYPGWEALTQAQKCAVIEEVIAQDIRPYIELDAGGVRVVEVLERNEVIIAYQGACTTCHSATGTTLNAIQGVLQSKVHPQLIVTPHF